MKGEPYVTFQEFLQFMDEHSKDPFVVILGINFQTFQIIILN